MKNLPLVLVALAGLILPLSCAKKTANSIKDAPDKLRAAGFMVFEEETAAPDFTLPDILTGEGVALSSLKNTVVFLNFWGEWCPYCKVEMPAMQKIHERLAGKNFIILGVNYGDSEEVAQKYLKDNGFTFRSVIDLSGSTVQSYGLEGFPTTFIIGKDGNILAAKIGPIPDEVEGLIQAFTALAE
jgi:thiol-disulfide isomerase/thioredoxin